jgi:hypothetical protein
MIAISAAVRSTDASTDAFSSFQYRKRNPAAQAALLRSIDKSVRRFTHSCPYAR